MNAYLILIIAGFLLITAGVVGYLQSVVVEKWYTDEVFTIKDGNSGKILQQNFRHNVAQEWKIVPRED